MRAPPASSALAPGPILVLILVLLLVGFPSAAAPEGVRLLATIRAEDVAPSVPLAGWRGKPLSAADVDGDGDLDILAQDGNARVYVLDPESGRALAEVAPRHPYGPDLGPFNGPKAADLDGDGVVELVTVDRAAVVSVWRLGPDGARLAWDRHLADLHARPTADAGPALGDLDRDGRIDIVVQTEERGLFALRANGTLLWTVDEYGGNAEPWIGDADGDGDLDVVAWTDGGVVHAIDGPTGEALWRFEVRDHGVWPGSIASRGLVADLDGDGSLEVVSCARNLEDATPEHVPGAPGYDEHHFALFLLREGELAWLRTPNWGHPLCSAYLMAHDVDGDGRAEILGLDWNTIGHKPGNWEQLGPAHAFAFDMDGRERWHVEVDAFNAKFPVVVADVVGDAEQEMVVYEDDALVLLDPEDGARVRRIGLGGWRVSQSLLVAELFGDGRQVLVVPVMGASPAILLFDAGVGRAAPAFGGLVDVPRVSRSPPPTPTPTSAPPPPTTAAPTDTLEMPGDPPALGIVPEDPAESRSSRPSRSIPAAGGALALAALLAAARSRGTRTGRRAPCRALRPARARPRTRARSRRTTGTGEARFS